MTIQLIIESFGSVNEKAELTGIAAVPRISRNGNLYTKTELARADGKRVPLNWEHDSSKVVGFATFHYNSELEQLFYDATVTDESTAALVRNKKMFTSIEADVRDVQQICNGPQDCFAMPVGLEFRGLALTEAPGIPETSVSIIEKFVGLIPHECSDSSLERESGNSDLMTSKTTKQETSETTKPCNCKAEAKEQECPDDKKVDGKCPEPKSEENLGGGPDDQTAGVDQEKPSETPCGPDMKMDGDGKCIPSANDGAGASDGPTIEAKVWAPNQDELNKKLDRVTSTLETLSTKVDDVTKVDETKAREQFNSNLYSVTKLSPSSSNGFAKDDINYITHEGRSQLKKFGSYSFDVDLSQEWVSEALRSRNRVSEAISFSGDPSNKVNVSNEIYVLPGGKYLKSIRDLVRFSEIPDGVDQIKLPKGNIPDSQTITEGSANAAGTHTADTVTLDADVVTGVPQTITKSQVEDVNFSIFDYTAQTARGEVLDSEATLTFDTAAAAATPGSTIGGAGAFDVDYLLQALEYYEDQGYPTEFGDLYCMLHPEQMREVRASTDITRFVQQGDATQTRTGKITHLYGIELIPSNAVNTAASLHNAVVGVKGHTFWLGSKRDLTIDMHKVPNQSAFDWMWTQRKGAKVFDEASYVRIQSTDA